MSVVKLIGFDMDGTLCFSKTAFDEVFEAAFGFSKSLVADVWMDAIMMRGSRTGIEAVHAVLPKATKVEADKILHSFSQLWAKQQILFDGVEDMLRKLRALPNTKLVLITNGPSIMQHYVIDHLNIKQYFDTAFSTGDEVLGYNKPDKHCFNKIAAKLKVSPQNCLFVGDGEVNDYQGAKSAGWDAYWVAPTNDNIAGSFGDCKMLNQPQKTAFKINWKTK